jgi:hypothetical protein
MKNECDMDYFQVHMVPLTIIVTLKSGPVVDVSVAAGG